MNVKFKTLESKMRLSVHFVIIFIALYPAGQCESSSNRGRDVQFNGDIQAV